MNFVPVGFLADIMAELLLLIIQQLLGHLHVSHCLLCTDVILSQCARAICSVEQRVLTGNTVTKYVSCKVSKVAAHKCSTNLPSHL